VVLFVGVLLVLSVVCCVGLSFLRWVSCVGWGRGLCGWCGDVVGIVWGGLILGLVWWEGLR